MPPTVALTKPTPGATFSSTLALAATAADDKGVSRVEFWLDSSRLTSDASAPYSYTWQVKSGTAQGDHTATARAYDTAGQVTSYAVTVRRTSAARSARRAAGWRIIATPQANGGTALSAVGVAGHSANVTYAKCKGRSKARTVKLVAGRKGQAARHLADNGVCIVRVLPN
jgi:hypothetical protein